MKVLFAICEGPHDAQFLGRLLRESGEFYLYEEEIGKYPHPLNGFLSRSYNNQNIDEIRLGKSSSPLIPVCALKNKDGNQLVLPVSMGGMNQIRRTIDFVKEVKSFSAPDALAVIESPIESVSFLFLYDADSRGVGETQREFSEKVAKNLELQKSGNGWVCGEGFFHSLFVFHDPQTGKGTLEDIVLSLVGTKHKVWVEKCQKHIRDNFEPQKEGDDEVAYQAKVNKSVILTLGQREKKCAGYALTMVIRDSAILEGMFDFNNALTTEFKLLKIIKFFFK